jgi:hypothetical protein
MNELTAADFFEGRADQLMEVQCAVPRVRWHLGVVPRDCFDETRQLLTEDFVYEDDDDEDADG